MNDASGLILKSVANAGILGTGTAFPKDRGRWRGNEDIYELIHGPDWATILKQKGWSPDFPREKFGFRRRFWVRTPGDACRPDEATTADLMEIAAQSALSNSGVAPADIDLVITATVTSPKYTSSLATLLAGRLGIRGAAFEMRSGCSSAVYALALAYQFLASGARAVLLATGETLSKITSLNSSHIFAAGDGGAAVVLGRTDDARRGLAACYLDADGEHADAMGVPGILPPTPDALARGEYVMSLSGSADQAIREKWQLIPNRLYAASNVKPEDIVAFVPNQTNRETVAQGGRFAGVRPEAVVDRIEEYANCGATGLLLALHDALESRTLGSGDLAMLAAVGGGLAWGGMLIRV